MRFVEFRIPAAGFFIACPNIFGPRNWGLNEMLPEQKETIGFRRLAHRMALSRSRILVVNPLARPKTARRKIKQLEASIREQNPPKTAYSWRV